MQMCFATRYLPFGKKKMYRCQSEYHILNFSLDFRETVWQHVFVFDDSGNWIEVDEKGFRGVNATNGLLALWGK